MTPSRSIERTFQRPLRALWPAAHVARQAAKSVACDSRPDAKPVYCPGAGSNNSTRLPEGSSSRICRPPGPATMSLRNFTSVFLRS